MQYASPIGAYQGWYADQPVQSRREANDRVGQIGGWRAYAKEIKSGEPASAKDAAPASDPHTGHHGEETMMPLRATHANWLCPHSDWQC